MGLKSALVTSIGDDHLGRFIREQLEREGVDTLHVITDPQRLTALVVLGIEDRDTLPLIFFRENYVQTVNDWRARGRSADSGWPSPKPGERA